MALSAADWKELTFKLGTVFRPTTPMNREDLFKGRKEQIRAVVDAINQPGQHAVLFGERGVGKTSLATMIFPNLRCDIGLPAIIIQVNCMSDDTFASMWKRVFEEILFNADDDSSEEDFAIPQQATDLLNKATYELSEPITVDTVRRALHILGRDRLVVIVLDEFDTVVDKAARRTMAETIKFLSDRIVPATVILIGVADDIEQLIENHRSIERCVSQIHMPRMSRDELESIVVAGLGKCDNMTLKKSALHEISRLAKGLPHYAHLLGLHAGRAAADSQSLVVDEAHVRIAVRQAIDQAQSSIKNDYNESTTSARKDAQFKQVLLACALADSDELGYFYPANVRTALSRIKQSECKIDAFAKHLSAFCEETKGQVLTKDEKTGRSRYRFTNSLLQPFVLLRGLSDGLLTEEHLRATRDINDAQGRLF